jgi:hypothetical protein
MASFDADTLRELRGVQEIAIRTHRHLKTAVLSTTLRLEPR